MAWIIWALFAVFSAAIAGSKNRSVVIWFLLGVLFGPFALLVAFMPKLEDADVADARRRGESDEHRKCPQCAEIIRREAVRCRYCSAEIPPLPRKRGLLEAIGHAAGQAYQDGKQPPKTPPS